MHNQKQIKEKGGSMRLGSYECKLVEDTIVSSSYNKKLLMKDIVIDTNSITISENYFLAKI